MSIDAEHHSRSFLDAYLALQARARLVTHWYCRNGGKLLLASAGLTLLTIYGMPDLHRAVRLYWLGKTTPITIEFGNHNQLRVIPDGSTVPVEAATVGGSGREFLADRAYNPGDKAYLTYSDEINYGAITAEPPGSFFSLLLDPNIAMGVIGGIIAVGLLIVSNAVLILMTVVGHAFGDETTEDLRRTAGGARQIALFGRAVLEGALAATLSYLLIAAALTVFSVSIKMKGQEGWVSAAAYAGLLLFLGGHLSALPIAWGLSALRSRLGRDLKEIVAVGIMLVSSVFLLIKLGRFMASDRIFDLRGWGDIVWEFCRTLLS